MNCSDFSGLKSSSFNNYKKNRHSKCFYYLFEMLNLFLSFSGVMTYRTVKLGETKQ